MYDATLLLEGKWLGDSFACVVVEVECDNKTFAHTIMIEGLYRPSSIALSSKHFTCITPHSYHSFCFQHNPPLVVDVIKVNCPLTTTTTSTEGREESLKRVKMCSLSVEYEKFFAGALSPFEWAWFRMRTHLTPNFRQLLFCGVFITFPGGSKGFWALSCTTHCATVECKEKLPLDAITNLSALLWNVMQKIGKLWRFFMVTIPLWMMKARSLDSIKMLTCCELVFLMLWC